MSRKRFKPGRRKVATVLGTTSALALAQWVQADTPADQPSDALAEVIVTATKRETNVQDTPVADTVFSQSALDESRVSDITDLAKFVPGVEYAQQGDQSGTMITMRGIGNDSAYTELDSPEVSTYINGIYSPRSQGTSSLMYDMDRVEVLRGPQGTLFGHNSTVGVIDLFTARPKLDGFAANAEAYFGNYNATGVRGMINLPVNDVLGFRIAYVTQKHDGYAAYQGIPPGLASSPGFSQNGSAGLNTSVFVTGGDQYYGEDRKSYRISGLFAPFDSFTWNVSFENYRDDGTPVVPLMQNPRPGEPLWSILAQFQPYNNRTSNDIRSNMDWKINSYLDLTYLYGNSRLGGNEQEEDDGGLVIPTSPTTPGNGAVEVADTVDSQFDSYSNELQLKSQGDNKVDWIVGLYQFRERNRIRFDINQYNGYAGGQFNWAGAFIQPDRSQEDKSAFGQAVWHVTDGVRLTAGIRNSFDDERDIGGRNVTFNGCAPPAISNCGPFTYGLSLQQLLANNYVASDNDAYTSSHKTTYLGRVDFDIAPHVLGYFSVGTGYHPGRVEDGGLHDNPETLTNYELGEKATLFDGRVTANTALYFENFQGYQVTSVVTQRNSAGDIIATQTEQVNAQGAKGYGLEFELAAKITPDDTVQLASSFQHTWMENLVTLDSRLYSLNPADPLANVANIKGNELPHAPAASATLGYDHSFGLPNGDALVSHVSTHFETMSWLSYYNERVPIGGVSDWDKQTAYSRTELAAIYKGQGDKKYEVEAYVRNLEDHNIKTNAYVYMVQNSANTLVPYPLAIYQPPRTYGITFRYRF
jgi:iron complex outermembrane receptor protein